jgi:hypothetical protein
VPWLRLDDKFARHPKIVQLSDREFRVHIRVLCYCAEYRTEGALPASIWTEITGLTRAMGDRFLEIGLWQKKRTNAALSVHDFNKYNPKDPTAADRMVRYRKRQRDGAVTDGDTETVSRAGARGPVPSPRSDDLRSLTSTAAPAESSAAEARPYEGDVAERLVRNGWWMEPHLADVLRERFLDVPESELERLCRLAGEIAEAAVTS